MTTEYQQILMEAQKAKCKRLHDRLFRRLAQDNRDTKLALLIRCHNMCRYHLLSYLRHKEFPQIQKAQYVVAAHSMIEYWDIRPAPLTRKSKQNWVFQDIKHPDYYD